MASNEDNIEYKRQSFSERFSDDLCEVVINCLPFEDKFRLMSVSKQLKRCLTNVLKRDEVIIIDMESTDERNAKKLLKKVIDRKFYDNEVDIKSLVRLLKMMSNTKEIRFNRHSKMTYKNKVLEAIADNCHHLKTIVFPLYWCQSEVLNGFVLKFGHSLKSISSINALDINCLKNCQQLTHLTINAKELNGNPFEDIESVVPHLRSLVIEGNAMSDTNLISISKLKNLRSITLSPNLLSNVWPLFITDLGFISLIDNCIDLKTIKICGKIRITNKTLNSVIDKAFKYPKVNYNYHLKSFNDLNDFQSLLNSFPHLFPKNITINGIYSPKK